MCLPPKLFVDLLRQRATRERGARKSTGEGRFEIFVDVNEHEYMVRIITSHVQQKTVGQDQEAKEVSWTAVEEKKFCRIN